MQTTQSGRYQLTQYAGETVRAFIPAPLPPAPPFKLAGELPALHERALAAVSRLDVASRMVPNAEWFLYGFVRKEAVVSSQIEGTQATLQDVVAQELARRRPPPDIEEVCNYVDALRHARQELASPKGLPLCTRLLCAVHGRLMGGVRGADKQPGQLRTSQNWIGGTRPGNAFFVPPPPAAVAGALGKLDRWLHADDPLPPLVRAGMAHVQFETIHPFLDGNGRVGRLLIVLLLEHWGLLNAPLLYLSLALKRRQQEYYQRLNAVRSAGDWAGWTQFFLTCVAEAANDGVGAATRLYTLLDIDRRKVLNHAAATISSARLFTLLPNHPMVTLASTVRVLKTTKPTASKAIEALQAVGVLRELSGKRRDRVYSYQKYLDILNEGTELKDRE